MYPKLFFENFWENKQENNLFVCMPFHGSLDGKFEKVIKPAAKASKFEDAKRVKEDWIANEITFKILDGIANSKLLLFDLSNDPKSPCKYSKQVNSNVLYELGIANAMREPEDMLLIREQSSVRLPFDITGLNISEYKKEDFTIEWLSKRLDVVLEKQKWFRSKRVKKVAQLVDMNSITKIMMEYSHYPEGDDHFHIEEDDMPTKISVCRLMDLGILWLASSFKLGSLPKEGRTINLAYRWTPFGYEVMKYLGIK